MKKKQEKQADIVATDYCCPSCDKPLYRQWGNQSHPNDRDFGVSLFCVNGDPEAKRHPQEVSGHAVFRRSDEKDESIFQRAYSIILARFCGAKLENEGTLVEIEVD